MKNTYDPYKYFKAPDGHPHKEEIDKKEIPMNHNNKVIMGPSGCGKTRLCLAYILLLNA